MKNECDDPFSMVRDIISWLGGTPRAEDGGKHKIRDKPAIKTIKSGGKE
jgi:hypothetical protein